MRNINIIYESPDYIVINKPAGVLMHKVRVRGGETRDEPTLTDFVIEKYPEIKKVGDDPETRPGIVHRIDKETSGVVVIARTQQYFEYLKNMFSKKNMEKKYIALVHGRIELDKGLIEKPIGIKSGTVKRTVYGGKMIKEAITDYTVLKRYEGHTLVEARPKTGRTHQIRVHLASIGHPIVGDKLYGGKKEKKRRSDQLLPCFNNLNRQFLHASELTFEARAGELVSFIAPLSDDLQDVLAGLI